jgi:hypothetical protein
LEPPWCRACSAHRHFFPIGAGSDGGCDFAAFARNAIFFGQEAGLVGGNIRNAHGSCDAVRRLVDFLFARVELLTIFIFRSSQQDLADSLASRST